MRSILKNGGHELHRRPFRLFEQIFALADLLAVGRHRGAQRGNHLPRLSESIFGLGRRDDCGLTIAGGRGVFCAEFGKLFFNDGDPQGFKLLEEAGSLVNPEIALKACCAL